jgi:hypothetical protein
MPPDVGADASPRADRVDRWRIPFWALQVLEFGVAFLLVTQSIHVGRGGILIACGVVLGLLAVFADGPLGAFRVCGQRLHVLLVAGAAIALGALAFVPALRPDAEGLLMIVVAAVVVVFLASRTTTNSGAGRRRRARRGRGPVIDATATVVPVPTATDDTDGNPGAPVGTEADDTDTAIRRAGRTTGAAAAAGKRVVDEHRPQVEDQVKRGLRGAGRLAGKLAGPKTPPDAR